MQRAASASGSRPATVPRLVAELGSSSLDTRENAAERLTQLATTDETRSEIVAASAARPLVALLSSSNPDERAPAANCLAALATSSSRRSTILAAGAVKKLWDMVLGSCTRSREASLSALCNLVHSEKARTELQKARAAPVLVGLLSRSSPKCQVITLGILRALAEVQRCREEMVAAGAVEKLVGFLSVNKEDGGRAQAAANALASLSRTNSIRTAIVEAGGLALLVALLRDGSDEQKVGAAGVIAAIGGEDPFDVESTAPDLSYPVSADLFLSEGTITALVDNLALGGMEVRAAATLAVYSLLQKNECQEPFIAAGGLPHLISTLQLCRGEAAQTRATSAETLRILASKSLQHREAIEAAVPMHQGREELIRTLNMYCF